MIKTKNIFNMLIVTCSIQCAMQPSYGMNNADEEIKTFIANRKTIAQQTIDKHRNLVSSLKKSNFVLWRLSERASIIEKTSKLAFYDSLSDDSLQHQTLNDFGTSQQNDMLSFDYVEKNCPACSTAQTELKYITFIEQLNNSAMKEKISSKESLDELSKKISKLEEEKKTLINIHKEEIWDIESEHLQDELKLVSKEKNLERIIENKRKEIFLLKEKNEEYNETFCSIHHLLVNVQKVVEDQQAKRKREENNNEKQLSHNSKWPKITQEKN